MNSQPEALRLADALDACGLTTDKIVSAELRRLYEENQELINALKMLHEAFCSDDYGTSEGRLQGRNALIATLKCLNQK